MSTYASTFISGTQDIVEKLLKEDINKLKVLKKLDGLIVYETDHPQEKIRQIRYLNNTFFVLKIIDSGNKNPLSTFIQQFIRDNNISVIPNHFITGKKSFRIVISEENNLIAINNDLLLKTEDYFSKILKLKVNRANPDLEIWIATRSEGLAFAGIRITKHSNYEKELHKGELHQQVTNLMCRLADLTPNDTVLDPFAGYGAIPFECANYFKVGKIFAADIDKRIFDLLKEKLSKTKIKITTGKWNALNLKSLTDSSIDKIITDPPWGQFKEISEINIFYSSMLGEFKRLLKPGGLAVILTSQKELFTNQVKGLQNFNLINQYNILLSGKKTGLFVIRKINTLTQEITHH